MLEKKHCALWFGKICLNLQGNPKKQTIMKKYLVSLMVACSVLVMLSGCVVSEEKLSDRVQQSMVEYEKAHGNELEVTDLKLDKAEGKGYKGVLTGKLNGEEVVYDVKVTDEGSDFDVDWEKR